MFSFIRRIFPFFAAVIAFCFLGNPAQAQFNRAEIDPAEIEAAKKVAGDFLKSLRQQRKDTAAELVAATARDELAAGFDADAKRLKAAPQVEFKFQQPKKFGNLEPVEYEFELVYAVKDEGKWTTALVRVYRLEAYPYRVEYWRIDNREPGAIAMADNPLLRQFSGFLLWFSLGVLVAGLALIVAIVWFVRRKPHVVAPEPISERRAAAVTTRDEAEIG